MTKGRLQNQNLEKEYFLSYISGNQSIMSISGDLFRTKLKMVPPLHNKPLSQLKRL